MQQPYSRFFLFFLTFTCILSACNDDDEALVDEDLTGKVLIYDLVSGSDYNVDGTITFEEKQDGSLKATIKIGATGEPLLHPAHLHYGSYAKDAEMAGMLGPVNGETGEGITEIVKLADGSTLGFDALKDFDGHVKIHGDDGPNKDVILAYGNIGKNINFSTNATAFAVCE